MKFKKALFGDFSAKTETKKYVCGKKMKSLLNKSIIPFFIYPFWGQLALVKHPPALENICFVFICLKNFFLPILDIFIQNMSALLEIVLSIHQSWRNIIFHLAYLVSCISGIFYQQKLHFSRLGNYPRRGWGWNLPHFQIQSKHFVG